MMRKYISLACLILVCRVFMCIAGAWSRGGVDKVNREINAWLQDKSLVSITQSSEAAVTFITVIADNGQGI